MATSDSPMQQKDNTKGCRLRELVQGKMERQQVEEQRKRDQEIERAIAGMLKFCCCRSIFCGSYETLSGS